VFAAPLIAGSLASAEERQLGTVAWQTMLPMPLRRQWAVKVLVVIGVACALGLGVPLLLAAATHARELSTRLYPIFAVGVVCVVILLSTLSLYVSSVCANSSQALLWSTAAGFAVMTFVSNWIGFFGLTIDFGFNPFEPLRGVGWWAWSGGSGRLAAILITWSALGLGVYAAGLVLLLRFARRNHRSGERSLRLVSRQVLVMGLCLTVMLGLLSGTSRLFSAEAEAFGRARMDRSYGYVTFEVVDIQGTLVNNYTVVIIPEEHVWPNGRPRAPYRIESGDRIDAFGHRGAHLMMPGRYWVVAVQKLDQAATEGVLDRTVRSPNLILTLKARATPVTIAAGESKTLRLTLSQS
jgi:hypothetical protein